MPPCALISSAAMAAALVSDAPATEDSSPITPILIGSEFCARAPNGATAIARTTHPNSHRRAPLVVLGIVQFLPGAAESGYCLVPRHFRSFAVRVQERSSCDKRTKTTGIS